MGGLFGGGSKKKSSSSSDATKTTTADSIETGDGTVYDRRGTAVPEPSTSPVASMSTPTEAMGAAPAAAAAPTEAKADSMMESVLPSSGGRGPRMRKRATLAGQSSYGFG